MNRARATRFSPVLLLLAVPFVYALSQGPSTDNAPAAKAAPPAIVGATALTAGACAPAPTRCGGVAPQPEIPACMASAADDSSTVGTGVRPRHGYCRCSCGYPCSTSADCGGVSCDPFITCC